MQGEQIKILLLEDDPLQAEIIKAMLISTDRFRVPVVAETLEEGLSLLKIENFNIIIVDLELPDCDGFETFLRVRNAAPDIAIVVLTGTGTDEIAKRTLKFGAQDYLTKWEMDQALLSRTIRYALDRKKYEIERRESLATINRIAEVLPEIVVLTEPNTRRLRFMNDRASKILGYNLQELHELTIEKLVHPDDLEGLKTNLDKILKSDEGEVVEFEQRVIHKNRELLWLDCRGIIYSRHDNGSPNRFLIAANDITERKGTLERLKASESMYRDLVENSGIYIGTHDANGTILSVNKQVLGFLGLDNEENILGRKISNFMPVHMRNQFQDYLDRIKASGHDSGVVKFVSPKGDKLILAYNNSVRVDEPGSQIIRCIGRDVTEQLSVEARLIESENRLKLALDSAGLGIWEWDIENDKVCVDELARELIGECHGGFNEFLSLVHPEDREDVRDHFDSAIRSDRTVQFEFRIKGLDESMRWIETSARLVRNDQALTEMMICVFNDVTERKKIETELYRSQRLESIGALASGIAHDLNNVLAPILMALHTLQQRFTDDNSQRWLSLVHQSAERGRDLIAQMIAFARGASGKHSPLQLRYLINDIENLLRETLPSNTKLTVEIPDDLWIITGDSTQIHQVLMNLCLNARDAMAEGGELKITAENLTLKDSDIKSHENVRPGTFIRLTVSDTGSGIQPGVLDRIFDPFFSTKDKGQGSGLGLSIVLGNVRGHGGFVTVESELDRGSKFNIFLPAQSTFLVDKDPHPALTLFPGQGETILIIDDEIFVCEVAKHTLESNGYRALTANDGKEALELLREYSDEIRVVLTDLTMSDINRLELIREIKRTIPNVGIIATSGVTSTGELVSATQAGVTSFLTKPFTGEKLLSVLGRLLDHRGNAA